MSEYSNCFDTAPFLQYHKAKKPDSFLFHFVETGLFSRFIEDRLFSTDDYGSQVEYFDEAMTFKRSKSNQYYVE